MGRNQRQPIRQRPPRPKPRKRRRRPRKREESSNKETRRNPSKTGRVNAPEDAIVTTSAIRNSPCQKPQAVARSTSPGAADGGGLCAAGVFVVGSRGEGPLAAGSRGEDPLAAGSRGGGPFAAGSRGEGPLAAGSRGGGPFAAGSRGGGPLAAGSRGGGSHAAGGVKKRRILGSPHLLAGGADSPGGDRGAAVHSLVGDLHVAVPCGGVPSEGVPHEGASRGGDLLGGALPGGECELLAAVGTRSLSTKFGGVRARNRTSLTQREHSAKHASRSVGSSILWSWASLHLLAGGADSPGGDRGAAVRSLGGDLLGGGLSGDDLFVGAAVGFLRRHVGGEPL